MHVILWLVACSLLTLPSIAFSKNATLMLTAHILHIDQNSRSGVIHVINDGDRTGVFELRWIDHIMSESGKLQTWNDPAQSPWSLQPYARFSPRRITLKPSESQVVRVVLKPKSRTAPLGEYFSHLRILTINSNLEETLKEQQNKVSKNVDSGITINAKIGMSIPVIWRNSDDKQKATIEFKRIDVASNDDNKSEPVKDEMLLKVTRHGLISTRGYIHVFIKKNGNREQIIGPHPFNIYANIESLELRLKMPEQYPSNGEFLVLYSDAKDNTDNIISSVTITY